MDDIMRLLFGREDGILSDLFCGDDADTLGRDDADGFGMADRARRAGQWCGTTPRRASGAGRPGAWRGVPRTIDEEFRIF